MTKIWVPSGRIPTKNREFSAVVADVRHAVFSVQRHRPAPGGLFNITPLGSGFFVSSEVFVTCRHVIDGPISPHQPGDLYRLVNNLDGEHGVIHEINGGVGIDIHLYPDNDFAILISKFKLDQAYLPISYADVPIGSAIGVAGYPLARLTTDSKGNLTLGGVVYRVAQGVATSFYKTNMDFNDGYPLKDVSIVEVNFMFVPGNSGGPIFEANTGRVVAYVKGFLNPKIADKKETCNLIPVPAGLGADYLTAVYAVYSVGLTLFPVREALEKFGVKL
jgi:hypothetical protein